MSKHRIFTFTRNNPSDGHAEDTVDCKYMIYGKEVGDSGTPHRQGTIQFKWQKTEKAVRKILTGCHVEICKDFEASIRYCKKDGDYVERGVPPATQEEKGKRNADRWDAIKAAGRAGPDAWDKLPSADYVQFKKFLKTEWDDESKKRKFDTMDYHDSETPHVWCYGESGTGKSRYYREEYPDAYFKMCNKWWDGYTGQETVLIEDLDEKHDVLGHHLKIWADRYPFLAERKGGAMMIRPKKVIVTSNFSPEDLWSDDRTLGPIKRRFKLEHKTHPFPLCLNGYASNFNPGQK